MPLHRSLIAIFLLAAPAAAAGEPWIITEDVTITEPTTVGDVIVALDGSLTVRDLPEPGLRVEGSLLAVHSGRIVLADSVIQFMSTYHGQYALAAVDDARIAVSGCDYRVPNGVQHALVVAGQAHLEVTDTDFVDAQLISADDAELEAARLNGRFEVIVQNDSRMTLADIPRDGGGGSLWVWVEFPEGSVASYTPPMPGFVDRWSFPPQGAVGIEQAIEVERCEALLWPMLVREGSKLTLENIPEDNWIVVGLYLEQPTTIAGLYNDTLYLDTHLELGGHDIRLADASIDTWNLYPRENAEVQVRDSVVGEILSMGGSRVDLFRTTVDGSGGFLGARDRSHIEAWQCRVTSTVEATQQGTISFHDCAIEPYDVDPDVQWTRFGAYDNGRLLADHTSVATIPALGGSGLIAGTYIADPSPPPAELIGVIAMFSLDEELLPAVWRVESFAPDGGPPQVIGSGTGNVEEGPVGVWSGALGGGDRLLRIVLVDGLGRTLTGWRRVAGTGPRMRQPGGRLPTD